MAIHNVYVFHNKLLIKIHDSINFVNIENTNKEFKGNLKRGLPGDIDF